MTAAVGAIRPMPIPHPSIICEAISRIMKKIHMLVCATEYSGATISDQKRNLLKIVNKIGECLQGNFQIKSLFDTGGACHAPPKLEITLCVEESRVAKTIRLLESAAHGSAADSYILVCPTQHPAMSQAAEIGEAIKAAQTH